jgi:hypothetical protein
MAQHEVQHRRHRFTLKDSSETLRVRLIDELEIDTPMGAQRRLDETGFDAGVEDGIDGPKTRAAVRRFQQFCHNNVGGTDPRVIDAGPIDGIFGPITREALLRFYGS